MLVLTVCPVWLKKNIIYVGNVKNKKNKKNTSLSLFCLVL